MPEGTRDIMEQTPSSRRLAIVHRTAAWNGSSPFRCIEKIHIPDGMWIFGTPEGTRTPDLLIRSQSLYPTELPAHTFAERLDIVAQGAKFVKHFLRSTGNIFENEGGSGEKK